MGREPKSMPVLSNDAKALLGSVFQHGCALTFQLIESRPTKRVGEALRELVAAQIIVREPGPVRADGSHAVNYRARVPTEAYQRFVKLGKGLQIAEPMSTPPRRTGGK